jgi:hypothetical protein
LVHEFTGEAIGKINIEHESRRQIFLLLQIFTG